eukprot:c18095_g1_i1.p1 GENE.c18095_g1_i1~~c18095_g1_i1.p1  ORF type:complete len:304 (+),score=67.45 c18095_g1_i1:184-1095(+)
MVSTRSRANSTASTASAAATSPIKAAAPKPKKPRKMATKQKTRKGSRVAELAAAVKEMEEDNEAEVMVDNKENAVVNANFNRTAGASSAEAILSDFDYEVESRAEQLRQFGADLCLKLKNIYLIELMKLPKQVRQMPISEFKSMYGGDVNLAVTGELQKIIDQVLPAKTPSVSDKLMTPRAGQSFIECTHQLTETRRITRSTTRQMHAQKHGEAATPTHFTPAIPRTLSFSSTPSVSQRSLLSVEVGTSRSDSAFLLHNSRGHPFNLSDASSVAGLSDEDKTAALIQLRNLNEQVQAVMSKLK